MQAVSVILAVGSPPGRSWRGIVRVSGPGCHAMAAAHVDMGTGDAGVHLTRFRAPGLDVPCVALVFRAPRSYTGEDALELQVPGHPALLDRIIAALLEAADARRLDARRAEPGEFSLRAFLHGRLSLTEAEGVAATIAARSDAQLRAARSLVQGRIGALAGSLADDLASALALVEAGIDFTDQEDVIAITPDALRERLQALLDALEQQLRRHAGAEQLESIPWVVLEGRPNAGKSTLFNALLNHPRAVVSDVPGTTRDVLIEPLTIDTPDGAAEVMLADAAGTDDAQRDPLGRHMQEAARSARERAELTLLCVPASGSIPAGASDNGERTLIVRTKSDLASGPIDAGMPVSAVRGEGILALRKAIAERLADRAVSLAADALVLLPRHEGALKTAREHLERALALVGPAAGWRHLDEPELVAACMRAALDAVGQVAGQVSPDDVLGRVFAGFCIGK